MEYFSRCCFLIYRKRRSVILEDDLKYVNQMEVSMHERLKMFKETESKGMEEIEVKCKFLALIGLGNLLLAKLLGAIPKEEVVYKVLWRRSVVQLTRGVRSSVWSAFEPILGRVAARDLFSRLVG